MTATPPDDTDLKFSAMKVVQQSVMDKMLTGQPVTDREKVQLLYSTMADVSVATLTLIKAMDEVERVRKSRAPKDIFKRIVNLGLVMPNTNDPKIIRAARADALKDYDKALADFDARAAELEALQRLKEQQAALSAAQAERMAELEQQREEITTAVASGTGRSITVAKPLSLKKSSPV